MFFLEQLANILHKESGGDLRGHCLVFPSRRAGLYFLKYYSVLLEKPVWAPDLMTINEFFAAFSKLTTADNEILLFELYKVFKKLYKSAESFDEFYFWGDVLINDFDDADKYLADASVLFRNVSDYRDIDRQFGDISPEQAEIIKRFWKNFEPGRFSREKENFKSVWSILTDLYKEFKDSLRSNGLAYEGMIYRDVAEDFKNDRIIDIKWKQVHFIGFNALNNCEISVMKELLKSGIARFYWDYDDSYLNTGKINSAGYFLKKNLQIFGDNMPEDWSHNTNLSHGSRQIKRNIIETTSDIAQVKLIPGLLSQLNNISQSDAHHTAIILADENLIVPVLSSLPAGSGDVNITMGYPLVMTEVYSLFSHLFELQRGSSYIDGSLTFHYKSVFEILRHQLIASLLEPEEIKLQQEITRFKMVHVQQNFLVKSEITGSIFAKPENPRYFSEYVKRILLLISSVSGREGEDNPDKTEQRLRNEFVYTVFLVINRLDRLINSQDFDFSTETYIRIFDKILRNKSVPFTGEPLSGIQIMGFLETRALDFRNIIMLSVNEGIIPSVNYGSSFIPFSLREAFGLPVINHQESVYAYHFYRLLHRAENVTFIYNSDSTGLRTGEMSRFLTQLKYSQQTGPKILSLSFDIRNPAMISPVLEKNDSHLELLYKLYSAEQTGAAFSPTAINTWLNCRMRFYYRYVNRLKEPEIIPEDTDHAIFGLVLHNVMKSVYSGYLNNEITSVTIDRLLKNVEELRQIIEESINVVSNGHSKRHLSGMDFIMRDILITYLIKILQADRLLTPFTITGLETPGFFVLEADSRGRKIKLKTGGNIDRIDRIGGITRIVDYKTGSIAEKISSVEDLFEDDRKKDLDGWLQTLLYCEAFLSDNKGLAVRPSIYNVRSLSADNLNDHLRIKENGNSEIIDDYMTIRTSFLEGLRITAGAVFSESEPFRMTAMNSKCSYCPYRILCQR